MWCSDSSVDRLFNRKWWRLWWSYIFLVLGQGYWKVNGIRKYQSLWLRYWMSLRCEKSCDHCMTLRYVPSRVDNRLMGQSTVICTGWQIGDCDHWSTDWRLWPAVFWLETGTAPFLIEDRLGFPSHGVTREGNCPLIIERGTVSNHIAKIRCLNVPWWYNASIGECESCGGSIIILETAKLIFG